MGFLIWAKNVNYGSKIFITKISIMFSLFVNFISDCVSCCSHRRYSPARGTTIASSHGARPWQHDPSSGDHHHPGVGPRACPQCFGGFQVSPIQAIDPGGSRCWHPRLKRATSLGRCSRSPKPSDLYPDPDHPAGNPRMKHSISSSSFLFLFY